MNYKVCYFPAKNMTEVLNLRFSYRCGSSGYDACWLGSMFQALPKLWHISTSLHHVIKFSVLTWF